VAVSTGPAGIAIDSDPDGQAPAPQPAGVAASSNVSRWNKTSSVTVTFAGPFGIPDGAGTVRFGLAPGSAIAVVRMESGLTRRAAP
jgi:hypothetical protein